MINFITIRDLDTTKHSIDKYAIVSVYFFEKKNND